MASGISRALLAGTTALLLAWPAAAQEWSPAKEIELVLPYGPGPGDVFARTVSPCIADRLGQPIVVVNRPGANTELGSLLVMNAPPDGHTLLFATSGLVTSLVTRSEPALDVRTDLAPITKAVVGVQGIFVNAELPVTTISELIDYARENPAEINYGTIGPGSVNQLTTEALAITTGIDIVHIPYPQGTSMMLSTLMGGEIQLVLTDITAGQAAVDSGNARLLGIVQAERMETRPDVPTLVESVPEMEEHAAYLWYAFVAPPETPVEIIDRYHGEITACLGDDAVVQALANVGYDRSQLIGNTPEEFKASIEEDFERLRDIVERGGIPIQ